MKSIKFAVCFLLLSVYAWTASAQKMNPEDILAKHLESIGTAETRASNKSRIALGDVLVTFVSQKNLTAQGRIVMASENTKNFLGMNLNANDYPLEKFTYDGKKAKVAYVRVGVRSILGNFILSNGLLLEEGLLGGTLSTSWALSNLETNRAKVSYEGTKKINGKESYVLSYSPKGGGDIEIKMYFDKETFLHLRTEYKRISSAAMGATNNRRDQSAAMDGSARQSETRLKVIEDFSDFKAEKGLNLPHSYKLNYSITGQNGTVEIQWDFNLKEFSFNQNLDAKTFDAEAN